MTKVTIDRELLELSLNGDEQQQAKARNKLRTLLGEQGAEEHEAVEVVGYLNESGTYYPSMDSVERYAPPGEWLRQLMTVAQHERILAARKRAQSAKVSEDLRAAMQQRDHYAARVETLELGLLRIADEFYPDNDSEMALALGEMREAVRSLVTDAAPAQPTQPALTVWEGAMPESNGKSNFTAVLMRKGGRLFDGLSRGMTIARSEYPDRVRYEADRVRYLIGELQEEPCILDYDTDKHSGYSAPAQPAADKDEVQRLREALDQLANGSHLDAARNHDDDSLREIAGCCTCGQRNRLLKHASRLEAALATDTAQKVGK